MLAWINGTPHVLLSGQWCILEPSAPAAPSASLRCASVQQYVEPVGVYNLRVTDRDGVVLQSLSGSGVVALEYIPQSAEPEVERAEARREDGASVLVVNRPNVIEPARVAILDDTDLARTAENNLRTAFSRAAHHQEHPEDAAGPIYWEFELEPGDGYWRSEIKAGDVALEEGGLGWQWRGRAVALRLLIERWPFFEGPRTQIPLSNGNGTNVTSALTVYNHDDSGTGHDTHVAIGTSGVTGALPCRAEVEITNTNATAKRTYDLFVGAHSWGGVTTFAPTLEAESATALTTTSVPSNASYSNGQARTLTWNGTSETALARFALSSSLLAACRGGYYRLFARFTTFPPAVWLRASVQLFDVTTIWEGEQKLLATNQELQELGVYQLPPYLAGESSVAGLSILLTGYIPSGASQSITLDYLYLMPVQRYRHYRPRGYGLEQNTLVRETTDGVIRSEGWSGGSIGHYVGYGGPLVLWPGRAQRLYLLHRCDDGTAEPLRTLGVRLWHRPRRMVL